MLRVIGLGFIMVMAISFLIITIFLAEWDFWTHEPLLGWLNVLCTIMWIYNLRVYSYKFNKALKEYKLQSEIRRMQRMF